MALSSVGRKALMPHGAQRKIARRLGIEEARVSAVVGGLDIPVTEQGWKPYRRIQRAVAKVLRMSVEEAFLPHERGVSEEAMVA